MSSTFTDQQESAHAELDEAVPATLVAALPAYQGVSAARIHIVTNEAAAERAQQALLAADVLGFDTESRPTFVKGQSSGGPHLIQLATDDQVFLFPVMDPVYLATAKAALEAQHILKVGFGLGDDQSRLRTRLAIHPANILDLARAMRERKGSDMGAKGAAARFLGMALQKSKKTSTSNWSLAPLSERQIRYAADDAHVALLTYRRWLALKNKP
ncbi:3'-5' exonuclease domain-containing protein 2 [Undibacterium sp. Jales W-56]|uniref:3'-5' exonuclease n=1 Tax=Undibacterium sp. Jales W-56 TaxID=2897325 RepID=UPI0021D0AD6B|nr:3'-5' exonuclease [Undibacterium sp. Jales W-56]MCU6432499.1 3'-5' exonuclease domain-containing protein 2 [Undibacterium sp. Jales W-56]